jgi:hypothetical protein
MAFCFKTTSGPSAPFMRDDNVTVKNPDGTTSSVPRTSFADCEYVVLTGGDYVSTYQTYASVMAEPFDAATAGQYFGFAFAMTVSIWALAYGAGEVIDFLRRS